jgi:hypothetical protein
VVPVALLVDAACSGDDAATTTAPEDFVLINLVEEGSEYPVARIIEIGPGAAVSHVAPIGGIARFLRSMPELEGVVSWP